MRVISVTGITGSGKTTTVETIISGLRRQRYSVGSVKDIHFEKFAIDTPGSNTDRHRSAGAQLVTARGMQETDVLFPGKLPIQKILSFYEHDWVVLEGVRDANVPRIICAHDEEGIEQQLDAYVIGIAGVIANRIDSEYKGLPVFNVLRESEQLLKFVEAKVPKLLPDFTAECCGLCGMSCRDLLGQINRGQASREDCVLEQRVRLKVGEQDITMVPFVQEVLAKTLIGLVSTLDGYQAHKPIEIKINND
ncbi:MAG: molybdopterin-guanine dinucleotide biosynthesis protein [Firmicutes bacterium]|nr:molybdopterin-guanine dinucleotide biosynthesis protein [Bacillota bacterium]